MCKYIFPLKRPEEPQIKSGGGFLWVVRGHPRVPYSSGAFCVQNRHSNETEPIRTVAGVRIIQAQQRMGEGRDKLGRLDSSVAGINGHNHLFHRFRRLLDLTGPRYEKQISYLLFQKGGLECVSNYSTVFEEGVN